MAFVAPKIFGGEESPTPVAGMGVEAPELAYLFKLEEADRFGDDILLKYKRR
jgi:diaminohydroxyphosphoribosylaminopyrimidine deaminase/5-amino-6-(5-phosphoribosylamino)uracil reductase